MVDELTNTVENGEIKSCPYDKDKMCIQIDNIEELRELIDTTAKEVKGVGDTVDGVNNRVNDLSDGLKAMLTAVNRTGDTVDKIFKLHFDKALSDEERYSELRLKIEEVSHKSELDNMKQNSNITNEKLNNYKEEEQDKKTLWQKAQLTAIGIGVAYVINGLISVGKDIYHLIITAPK